MISGVNFQPGGQQGDPSQSRPSSGVQEAIKVLSLRLPKVVGAQGMSPQALLTAQGSGGSRVDSVVNQVLARILPTGPQSTPPGQSPMPRVVGPREGESGTMPVSPPVRFEGGAPGGSQAPSPFGGLVKRDPSWRPAPPAAPRIVPGDVGRLPEMGPAEPAPDFGMLEQLLGGFTFPDQPRAPEY